MRKSSDPTEKPAGEATQCLGGAVHVYYSSEGDRWARLCVIAAASPSSTRRADVLLSPEQAAMAASAMEKTQPQFLCVAKGMLWYRRHSTPFLAVLGVECAFGNGGAEVRATAEHLRQIAAALRAASASPPAPPGGADPLCDARRRTDDNLRRVFG